MLNAVSRPKVPEAIINKCCVGDRIVVENILVLVQDVISFCNIALTSIEPKNNSYYITVPFATPSTVSLEDLRCIEAYSPARIASLSVQLTDTDQYLRMTIVDEKSMLSTTQVDIIRITKKQRLF